MQTLLLEVKNCQWKSLYFNVVKYLILLWFTCINMLTVKLLGTLETPKKKLPLGIILLLTQLLDVSYIFNAPMYISVAL